MGHTIEANRAPVLTLWGVVVAERLGHDAEAALTLGKVMAGLNAQAKGRSLGIFGPRPGPDGEPAAKSGLGEDDWVRLLGRPVPVRKSARGVRAVVGADEVDPAKVTAYLVKQFGAALPAVRDAMVSLASTYSVPDLETRAYDLYEKFRPATPSGKAGWGRKGALDLDRIRALSAGH